MVNKRTRMKRKMVWDKRGVSEVIGTILTMSITVILFSSIMLMVNRFPQPSDNTFVTFSGYVDPIDDWDQGAYINLTNTGGIAMPGGYTMLFLKVDDMTYILRARGTHNSTLYGLQGSNEDWEAGDLWSFKVAPNNISALSVVNVAIVDIDKDTVVWTHELFGGDQSFSPIISDGWVDSLPDTPRRDPISFNHEFTFHVKVIDPNDDLDTSSVWVDMSDIGLSDHIVLTDPELDGTYECVTMMGDFRSIGYYKLRVYASDMDGHNVSNSITVPVGQDIGNVVNLAVANDTIKFSIDNPMHGDILTISAVVRNTGMDYTWAEVYFYDGNSSTPIGNDTILISGVDSQTAFISWRAAPGGIHNISVEAVVRAPKEDYDIRDNSNYTFISVLPTILLVDDDNHENDRSEADTVSYMRSALESCSLKYDYLKISENMNGPAFDYGDYRLQNYDIVVWMTGYESTSTLTLTDQNNLQRYLNDTSNDRNNTGSLWLIGNNWLEDNNFDPAVSNFTKDYLHIENYTTYIPTLGDLMNGNSSHIVGSEWADPDGFEMIKRENCDETNYSINKAIASNGEVLNMMEMGNNITAISFENTTLDERIVVFPWEFSRIDDPAIQTQLAFRVIRWLGGVNETLGKDLAISRQVIDPQYVFYQQDVTISATIRNNGQDDLTNVQAIMSIDGEEYPDSMRTIDLEGEGGSVRVFYNWSANLVGTHIIKWKVDPNNVIKETNEYNNEVSDYLSTGELIVEFRILVVDDDDSSNNMGSEKDETAAVRSVMDDLGYIYENHTVNMSVSVDGPDREILDDYSAIIWVTGNASGDNALTTVDEDNIINYMSENNGRLWLIGANCLGNSTSFTFENTLFGIQSINTNEALPSILNGVEDDPITHGMELQILEGNDADTIVPIPEAKGILIDDNEYYGVCYESNTSMSVVMTMSFMNIIGDDDDNYISGENARRELGYMIFHWFGKPDMRTELRITKIDFSISNAHPTLGDAYILQATIHNAGLIEGTPLVRFMDGDTQIGSDSLGIDPDDTTTAEVIWRPLFAGSRNISVRVDPPDVSGVNEIFEDFNNEIVMPIYVYYFWDDMESGQGSLNKWSHYSTVVNINGENPIDYFTTTTDMDTDIISDWNESASMEVQVVDDTYHTYNSSYYMREGTGIFGEIDVLISFALDDSKSMTQRYQDEDLTVDSDGDGDATNDPDITWLEAAKNAALILLNELSDNSVCVSIWDFSGNNERRWSGPDEGIGGRLATDPAASTNLNRLPVRLGDTYINATGDPIDGRQKIRDEIIAMDNPSGTTILWDAIGEAYLDNLWWRPYYSMDLLPVVIVLSDGADCQASDQAGIAANRIEGGSDYWCPWDDIDNGLQDYGDNGHSMHYGKYTFEWDDPLGTTQWLEAGSLGAMQYTDRLGLLGAKMKIFTIGLGLEHHDPPYEPEIVDPAPYPGDEALDNDNAFYNGTNGQYYATNPEIYQQSGTLEYNLWKLATSTGAEYFHAPSADDLEDIFYQLGALLGSGFNQTRSGGEDSRASTLHDNSDKRAVTETFNLTGVESAKLSFWHKYKLIQGGNGAFLQVAYKNDAVDSNGDGDPTNDWDLKYVVPPGQYSGGLYFNYNVLDDFNTTIKWCWNGLSGGGTYAWDYVNVDISPYIPEGYRDEVRLVFNYTQFGGGLGEGWWIDDVNLKVSRYDGINPSPGDDYKDIWNLVNMTDMNMSANSGDHAWANFDPDTGYMKGGIDNSLQTMPIDLSNAQNAYLSAYVKFNLNNDTGTPPDGFRVEISINGGMTWHSMSQAYRAASGVSTGSNGWTYIDDLNEINVDLTNWRGYQIILRFRVCTSSELGYDHYDIAAVDGGFYVDDVQIKGESIHN